MNELEFFLERYNASIFGKQDTRRGWDWKVAQPEWMLDKLIPEQSIGMIYGPSNSGKSHLICDMLVAILKGKPHWQGIPIKTGPVVLFTESPGHIKARLKAYAENTQGEIVHDLYLIPTAALEVEDIDLLATYLSKLPIPPINITFDTMATAFSFEENDNREASKLIKAIDSKLVPWMDPDGSIWLAHHTSKGSDGRSARGASALIANIDWSIRVEYDKSIERTIASWEKDRWRLIDESPRWCGQMHRVSVEFENGDTDMAILEWEPYSEEAQALEEQLADERKAEGMKSELADMLRAHGRDAFFAHSGKRFDAYESLKFTMPKAWQSRATELKQWIRETHKTEPVYNARGTECGFLVKFKKG